MLSISTVAALSLVANHPALHPSPRRVAVKNVAYEASEGAVARALSAFGEVEAVELAKVHHGKHHGRQHHGYGWVAFATEEAAVMAAASAKGEVRLHGRDLFVKMADVHHPRSQRTRTRKVALAPTLLTHAAELVKADARTLQLEHLREATDVDEIEALIDELGELRSAEEYAIARYALENSAAAQAEAQRDVVSKVEARQQVDADQYRIAGFSI